MKKDKDKNSELSETGELSELSETGELSSNLFHLFHVSPHFESVFSGSIKDKILKHFCETNNTQESLVNLAQKIGENFNSVKTAIYRNSELFNETSGQGVKSETSLNQVGIKEIKTRIENLEKKSEMEKLLKETKAREKQTEEELLESIKRLSKELNLDREAKTITLDFNEILENDSQIADYLLDNPEEFSTKFSECFSEDYSINYKNLPKSCECSIENLRNEHLDKLSVITARVISQSDVRPQVVNAKFECPICGTIISVLQIEKKFREPTRCSCGRKGHFKLLSKEMVDSAKIKLKDLQEKTDNPHEKELNAFIQGDLTNSKNIMMFAPGNEVKVTGVLKEIPIHLGNGSICTRFDLALEIYGAEPSQEEVDISKFTKEEIKQIEELSYKINEEGLSAISSSFCPEINGHEYIKQALILQSCNRRNTGISEKNKSNILLIGDPGLAKSVLGNFVVRITPGSQKAVGGSSSAVGITASIVKEDKDYGGYRLEPGAMVLSKEILFLDELNNLSDEDKPRLQEGLSEQRITINKASIHTSMKVSCGTLASANPIHGHFDPLQDITKQFNISPPILNRFDTIFVMRDSPNKDSDSAIAKTMIQRTRGKIKAQYSENFLKRFFVYIRNQAEPIISDDMEEKLSRLYSEIRQNPNTSLKINARFVESMIRMLKASAKLRLSSEIEEKDVERTLEILRHSHYSTSDYEYFKKYLEQEPEVIKI